MYICCHIPLLADILSFIAMYGPGLPEQENNALALSPCLHLQRQELFNLIKMENISCIFHHP